MDVCMYVCMYIYWPASRFGTANTCIIYQTSRLFTLKKCKILLSLMLHTSIDVFKKYTCYISILNLPDDQYCSQSTLLLD